MKIWSISMPLYLYGEHLMIFIVGYVWAKIETTLYVTHVKDTIFTKNVLNGGIGLAEMKHVQSANILPLSKYISSLGFNILDFY
jgi:hypothetical protein